MAVALTRVCVQFAVLPIVASGNVALAAADADADLDDSLSLIQMRVAQMPVRVVQASPKVAMEACVDSPADWQGSSGRTCESYAQDALCTPEGGYGSGWGEAFGKFDDYVDADGNTAVTACCACGGGTTTADNVVSAKEEKCDESPAGWKGSGGRTCESYAQDALCTPDGGYGSGWGADFGTFDDYVDGDGNTAVTACCQCGGGVRAGEDTADGNPGDKADGKAKDKGTDKLDGKAKHKATGKVDGKAKDKAEGKADDKIKDKADGNATDKANGKDDGKAKDKADDNADGKMTDKAGGKAKDKADGKVDGKATDKADDKADGKAKDKADGKVDGKAKDKVDDKADGKVKDKVDGKAKDKADDKVDGKAKHKADGKVDGKAKDKVDDKADGKVKDKADGKAKDKADGKVDGKAADKADDTADGKAKDKADGKAVGKATHKADGQVKDEADGKIDVEAEDGDDDEDEDKEEAKGKRGGVKVDAGGEDKVEDEVEDKSTAATSEVPAYIPTVHDNTDETCDGTDTPWGQKGQKKEVESLEDCQEFCSKDVECRFIQYQPDDSMCHLYSDCSKTRSCDKNCARTLRRLLASAFLPREGYDQTDQTCDGTGSDWGTKGRIKDTESLQECEEFCTRDPECRFIQFQASASRCHMYQGCSDPRPCASECERTLKRLTAGVFIPTVYDRTGQTCDGTDTILGEKKGEMEAAESIDECKMLCSHKEDCQFIQFQEAKSMCHMYQSCDKARTCDSECERTLQRLIPGTLIPTIHDKSAETCDGSDSEWGSEGKIEDADTLEECNQLCGDEEECHFIQFEPKKKTCHLYVDCSSARTCDDVGSRTLKRMKVLHA